MWIFISRENAETRAIKNSKGKYESMNVRAWKVIYVKYWNAVGRFMTDKDMGLFNFDWLSDTTLRNHFI